jgi:hypothetical protein
VKNRTLTAIAACAAVLEGDPLEHLSGIGGVLLGAVPPAAEASIHADLARTPVVAGVRKGSVERGCRTEAKESCQLTTSKQRRRKGEELRTEV